MYKLFKYSTYIVIIFSLVASTIQVGSYMDINGPKACCNEGVCQEADCHMDVTIQYEPLCLDVTGHCNECLIALQDKSLCETGYYPDVPWCDSNGVKYYWGHIQETRKITFDNTDPTGGRYSMGGTYYYPPDEEEFGYLNTHQLSATGVFRTGTPGNYKWWAFKEWNFGSGQNPVSYQIQSDATIYAIYEEYDPTKSSKIIVGISQQLNHQYAEVDVSEAANIPLLDNYPNPFNPRTNIRFNIVEPSDINLEVYDNLGKKITTLVTGYKQKGSYNIIFNADYLPSGIYFYRLETNKGSFTKKMLLMK